MTKPQENGTGKKDRPPGKKRWLLVLLAAVAVIAMVIAVSGLVSAIYLREAGSRSTEAGEAPKRESAGRPYRMYGPQDFTVNLADTAQRRYLKVTVTLAYEEKALAKELEQRKAQVRDVIIDILRSRTVDDIFDIEGTEKLRGDIIDRLNGILNGGAIREVYFTDFLIQ